MELLTGQKSLSSARSEEGRTLASYFISSIENGMLFDIIDVQVLEDAPKEEIAKVAEISQRCLNVKGRNRPTMKEVAMSNHQF